MEQNDQFQKLLHAYQTGKLLVHNALKNEISPEEADYAYQTVTSAFMFPLRGEAKIQLDETFYYARAGKMIYIPYATDIKFTLLGNESYEYINIFHQYPERLNFEMEIADIFADVRKLLFELVERCQSTTTKKNVQHCLSLKNLFHLLQHKNSAPTYHNHVVSFLQEYMNTHYQQEISLEKLAQLVNLKASQVSYLFKKHTNQRPIDYLIQYRIEKAAELIETTDLRISEIAEKVGYQDPFYFSRLFKKRTNLSPNALRWQSKQCK